MRPPFRFMPPLGPRASSPRERVLAAWHGVNLKPMEVARSVTAKHSSDLMPGVLKSLRIDRRRTESEIVKVWKDLISPVIAAHAQPTGLRNGTLFVSVDSSPWLSEIVRYHQREILERLHHSFGRDLIKRISFRLG